MPKFSVTDTIFQGFDAEGFVSDLPHEDEYQAAGIDPRAASFLRELAVPQWKNFSRISRLDILNEAERFGVPLFRSGPAGAKIRDMFRGARMVTSSQVVSATTPMLGGLQAAISGELLTFDQALAQVGSGIPVVGPLVSLAAGLVRSIRDAIVGTQDEPAARPALTYSRAADASFTQRLLGFMRESEDWTPIFLPVRPGSDGFESVVVEAGGRRGMAFRSKLFGEKDSPAFQDAQGIGVLPKLANVDPIRQKYGDFQPNNTAGAVGFWQYLKTGSRDPDWNAVRGYPAYYPSSTQAGMYAWQRVMAPSRAMFRIDGDRIADAWRDYFDRMIFWAQTQSDEVLRRIALYCASWGNPRMFGPSADLGAFPAAAGNKFFRTWSLADYPAEVRKWPGSMGELVAWVMRSRYQRRLRPALRTLVCAYVPPDAPALLADASLFEYYEQMRAKLLQHPARYDVERELVPDQAYRQAIYQRTLAADVGITAKGAAAARALGSFDGAPEFEPGDAPPKDNGPTGQGASPGPIDWAREHPYHVAAGAGAVLAGAGAAWYLTKGRR